MKKPTTKYTPRTKVSKVEEPAVVYHIASKIKEAETRVKDFTYKSFKKILTKSPFTLAEWADMLFMSERSLHRYAKEDGAFNGLQIERILLLEILIDMGNDMFGKEGFKNWLPSKPFSLNGAVVKSKLNTHNGIQEVIDTLGKMQHGISA